MKNQPKDCAFQYYIGNKMIEDTGLITRDEAEALWEKHRNHFIQFCEKEYKYDENAEMALWIDMRNEVNYRTTAKRVDSRDVVIEGGMAFVIKKERVL